MTYSLCDNETVELSRTIVRLSELHEALEVNSFTEEAELVLKHIEMLQSPQTESRVLIEGIDFVMKELSTVFSETYEN